MKIVTTKIPDGANIIIADTEQGRGILGVIDGYSPKGVEGEKYVQARKQLLRRTGYKL